MAKRALTPRMIARLRAYDKAQTTFDTLAASVFEPWARQINGALVSLGYLARDPVYPGLCTITEEGRMTLAMMDLGDDQA